MTPTPAPPAGPHHEPVGINADYHSGPVAAASLSLHRLLTLPANPRSACRGSAGGLEFPLFRGQVNIGQLMLRLHDTAVHS